MTGELGTLSVISAALLCSDDITHGSDAARAILAAHPHARLSYYRGRHDPGFRVGYVGV